jgi:hypothetical protein
MKDSSNATLRQFSSLTRIGHFARACLPLLLFAFLATVSPVFAVDPSAYASAAPVAALPSRLPLQENALAADLLLPVLTPVTSAGISLHTHTVDISLTPSDSLVLNVAMSAVYRLHNDGSEAATITLRVPQVGSGTLALAADGVPLAPSSQEDGTLTVAVLVEPDQPVVLTLDFSDVIIDRRLPQLRYLSAELNQWLGQVSMRLDIRPAANMPPASWLRVLPEDWAYAPPGVSPDPAVRWLYDGSPPDAFVFEALHPSVWQQIQTAEQAASPGAAAGAFAQLGDLYATLAQGAAAEGNAAVAERFYSQAVAAYSSGIRQAEAAGAAPELGSLHGGLAALYRSRVVGADGASNPVYAELMTAQASSALGTLAADDTRRAELERWQAEGLRLLLTDARRRGDVTVALALIDRLALSSAGAGAAGFLAEERKALVVQQALELLERGDRSAAFALAGDAIADPALQPPADLRSLFAAWAATASMSEGGISLDVTAWPNPDRVEDATTALNGIVQSWGDSEATRGAGAELEAGPQASEAATEALDERVNGQQANALHLRLRLPAGATGVALAETLPGSADWVLLRSLLAQLGPKLDSSVDGLRQQVHVSQPVDLRSAGQQWAAMAQNLDDQAAAFEAQASSTAQGEASTMDASLDARIRAANYRHAAEAWRNLARDSYVELSLAASGSLGNNARTWLVTVNSPPQMLDVQVDSLNTGRVALALGGLGLVLLAVAGLLWRLLV